MVKYLTHGRYSDEIDTIEIEKESKHCIWTKNPNYTNLRRENKITSYWIYHDTWELARMYLLINAESSLKSAITQVSHTRRHLKKIQKLKRKG